MKNLLFRFQFKYTLNIFDDWSIALGFIYNIDSMRTIVSLVVLHGLRQSYIKFLNSVFSLP